MTGAPEPVYPPELDGFIAASEAAEAANDLDALNRLEVHCWLDGPLAPEGRVGGHARALALEMNGRTLAAPPVGDERVLAPAWPRLDRIAVPVRVIVGTLDLPHVVGNARYVAESVQRGQLVVWDGVGHLPSLEAPDRLYAEIAGFLAGL